MPKKRGSKSITSRRRKGIVDEVRELDKRINNPNYRHIEGGKCPHTKTLFKGTIVKTIFAPDPELIGSRGTYEYRCSECGNTYLEESHC